MKIRNVNGSTTISPNPPSGYSSWIDYWKGHQTLGNWLIFQMSHNSAYECPMCGKSVPLHMVVGAHVQKVNSSDEKWYIYPICDSCNKQPGKQSLNDIVDLWMTPLPSNI